MQVRTLALFFSSLLSACQVAPLGPGPMFAEPPNNDPDLILSFGKNSDLDIVFGSDGAGGLTQLPGPLGQKVVVPGVQFYLARKNGGRSISTRDVDVPEPDNRWSWWYHRIEETLAQTWEGTVPGKAQFILRVTPDRQIAIIREIAFTPAVGKDGHFDVSTETHGKFISAVEKCLKKVSGPKLPDLPVHGRADFISATFVATFQADRNLYVSVPNLAILTELPRDEKSLWTARICTILDAGYLYTESDVLRKRLPARFHHPFIPANDFPHSIEPTNYGPGTGGLWSVWYMPDSLDHETSTTIVSALEDYLDSGHFSEAQGFAISVAREYRWTQESGPVDGTLRVLGFNKLKRGDIEGVKVEVGEAAKKGYFEMDWNDKHVPTEARGNWLRVH